MQLKTTSEQVFDLIKRYDHKPSVKTALTELFGELPIELAAINIEKISNADLTKVFNNAELPPLIQIRGTGIYKGKGFYLNSDYKWQVVMDNEGQVCLVASE